MFFTFLKIVMCVATFGITQVYPSPSPRLSSTARNLTAASSQYKTVANAIKKRNS
jgi:hypothetical protein